MTFATLSVSARGPGPASGEEMLACLRQVIAAADDLTRRFRARIPGMDDHPLTPFALHEIAWPAGAACRRSRWRGSWPCRRPAPPD